MPSQDKLYLLQTQFSTGALQYRGHALSSISAPFVLPLTQRRACYSAHQGRSQRNIKNGKREDQNSGQESRNNRCQPCVLNDVSENKKQQRRWDHGETTIKRVDETKAMPEDKAGGAKQKQTPDCRL